MNVHRATAGTLGLLLALSLQARSEDLEWSTEVGFLTSYHDNYFHRDDDGVTPDETFFTVYGEGDVAFDVGRGEVELSAGGSGAFARKLGDADYQTATAGLRYKRHGTRVITKYTHVENRVFGEEDDASFFDLDSGKIEVRQELFDELSVRGSTKIARWDFDSLESGRDSLQYEFKGMLRWALFEWLAIRGSFLWALKNADDSRFDWEGPGFVVAAELPCDPVNVFVRYRRRWRSYDGAPSGDSNFHRDDVIDDVTANVRWHVTDLFGLQVGGSYRHGDSDRRDRNYDTGSITGGFFVSLGSK